MFKVLDYIKVPRTYLLLLAYHALLDQLLVTFIIIIYFPIKPVNVSILHFCGLFGWPLSQLGKTFRATRALFLAHVLFDAVIQSAVYLCYLFF